MEVESAIFCAFVVDGDIIGAFKSVDEMEGVVFGMVFDAKVVNAKAEFRWSCCMCPNVW